MSYGHILKKLRDGDLNLRDARQGILAAAEQPAPKEIQAASEGPGPAGGPAQLKVSPDALREELIGSLAEVLYMEPAGIEPDQPFSDLGLDSLISVEWINALRKTYGVKIPATKVYDYPTIETFSQFLKEEIDRSRTRSVENYPAEAESGLAVSRAVEEPAFARSAVLEFPTPATSTGRAEGLKPEDLGNPIFQKRHGCRASFFAGSMYRGIASERMVVAMAQANLLSFFGSAGFDSEELEPRIQSIQRELAQSGANLPYGICLISDLRDPDEEMAHVDLFLKYNIPAIEASAFLSMTPALVYCRLRGITEEGGRIVSPRRIVAKCSRLEVARRFCSPAPLNVVRELVAGGRLTEEEARLSQRVPMSSDIAVEADSGGHTDQGVAFCLLPSIVALKDSLAREYRYEEPILVGCGGGIGTPQAVAAAFAMGADFVFTGSINQCTVESGAHGAVKELLSTLNIHDTGIAPAADMFEIGARVQVVRRKTRFPERANRLYQLFQRYQSIEEIPEAVKEDIEKTIFKRSFSEVWDNVRAYKRRTHPEQIQAALDNPRLHMKMIFQWYMVHSNQMALTGDASESDNFQIHCGPAMGAFNQWVRGTDLEDWRNRRVAEISDLLLRRACEHIEAQFVQTKHPPVNARAAFPAGRSQTSSSPDREIKRQDIAVIGMAGRFPMARDLSAFWDNLAAGRDCISEVSPDRWPPEFFDPRPAAPGKSYSKWMGMLEDVDKFDPLFFNISPVDAEAMDPQQRLFLETCWSCIEDAGYDPTRLAGSRCGVFAGCGSGDYGSGGAEVDASTLMGASMSILAARISYVLNLQGPCMAIDTACSSSLVAIATACDSLILGSGDLALAGGVSVMAGPSLHIVTSKAGMLSPDGRCFTFDRRANGFVPGEGVGVVLLKRLADAERDGDRIDAVIRGWGVNQDGKTNGITAPSGDSQMRLEKYVYDRFGVNPESIQMIEAHGTGTKLGDPVEVEGLKASFQGFTSRKRYCALGSVKSNVGHLLAAAGVAGVIKSTLALKQRKIPPTIHFETLNEHIELDGSPFYVNTSCRDWIVEADGIRRAAVSGFGFSGTNAHIVLEEYPSSPPTEIAREPSSPAVILLSAKNEDRLREMGANLLRYLAGPFETSGYSLQDLAYTLQTGRTAMPERLAFVARSAAAAKTLLESWLAGNDLAGVSRGRIPRDKAGSRLAAGDGMIQKYISQRDSGKLAELWVNGAEIDWSGLHAGGKRRRLSLPTYPFARERYWRQTKRTENADRPESGGEHSVTLLCRPVWKAASLPASSAPVDSDNSHQFVRHLILLTGRFASQAATIESRLPGARCAALRSAAAGAVVSFEAAGCQAFEEIQALLLESIPGKTLVQVLVDRAGEGQLMSGLAGLLKTATLENPAILGQVIESGADGDAVSILLENRMRAGDTQVRYVDGERRVLVFEELTDPPAEPSHCWRDGGVYLITGAGGGLGLLFAGEIAAKAVSPRLILIGRSALDERRRARLEALRSTGAQVEYHELDVTNELAVARLMTGIRRDFGRLDGVLHSAGTNRDNFLTRKPAAEFKAVLAPKVRGAVLLERASRDLAPEWIVLFSSCSGVTGNVGQADYAAANAFMDAFAHWRNLSASGGPTRIVSIDWPLWRDGGMRVDDATLATMRERMGAAPMSAAAGLKAFYRTMAGEVSQVMILSGEENRLRRGLLPAAPPQALDTPLVPLPEVDEHTLRDRTLDRVKSLLGEALKLATERINEFEPLESYGIDSILVTQLNLRLGRVFPEVSQTLLFEVRNLHQLAGRLVHLFPAGCIRWTGLDAPKAWAATAPRPYPSLLPALFPKNGPGENRLRESRSERALDIAIIGLSGRYPMAPDVNVFWANLRDGRDCITEVPPERWNWRDYYSEGMNRGHSTKWGGFIDDVDKFDPQFFSISPKVARYLDPQERLMLEETWKAIEDAGYRPRDLRPKHLDDAAPDVGVYVGSTYTEYQLFGAEAAMAGKPAAYAGNLAGIANRVSYALDLHGPSVAVDTMCSSSLTCIHLACQDLKAGRTRMAIVGSINLSIHPNKYRVLSGGQFLSSHGRCKSFGDGGDGYIPSEGIGVVLLKPLADARRDGDHIYGVIKGSAVNHSGRTNGYSVPNPDAQKRVIMQALDEAGIDPAQVSYVEAHGTGTKLGDPIEIAGLTKAFGPRPGGARCWIGSAKSNIGHCEAAAGLAGVTKILLQMKHRQIAPSIHSRVLNPRIDFASGPFEVNQELRDWAPPTVDGKPGRRIAGISSFGAGGSNAHLVIEEYAPPLDSEATLELEPATTHPAKLSSALIVLSARNETQLREVAGNLLKFLDPSQISGIAIQDIAYTLQTGRKAMEERLGFAAASIGELRDQLNLFLRGDSTPRAHIRGRVEEFSGNAEPGTADSHLGDTIEHLAAQGAAGAILQLWVSGYEFDWRRLYGTPLPRRISLPAYPFARQRYWVEKTDSVLTVDVAHTELSEAPATLEKPGRVAPPTVSTHASAGSVSRESLEESLLASLATTLCMEPGEIHPNTPFINMGLDSVVGVEWVQQINRKWGLDITAASVYDHPTLRQFSALIYGRIHVPSPPAPLTSQPEVVALPDAAPIEKPGSIRLSPLATNSLSSASVSTGAASQSTMESLEQGLLTSLAKTLCMEPDEIRPDTPFVNMGLDSVVGVEWVQQINQRWKLDITAASVYDHPALRLFTAFVRERIESRSPGARPPVESPPAAAVEKPSRIQLRSLAANPLPFAPDSRSRANVQASHPPDPTPAVNPVAAAQPSAPVGAPSPSRESLEQYLLASLAKTLSMEPDEIRPNTPFVNMGLDSVVGVEWVQQINRKWGLDITAASVYDQPTLRQFTAFIYEQIRSRVSPESVTSRPAAPAPAQDPQAEGRAAPPTDHPKDVNSSRIAVIGMSGRFPGAADVEAFWTLLENGQSAFSAIPKNRDWDLVHPTLGLDKAYVRRGAFLDEIDCFDPLFFQMSPKEAATLDPCERLFLEESWKAIEDAGIDPTQLSGRRWGVFCGNGGDYSLHLLKILGYSPRVTLSQVPTRVSHCLNLSGPSLSVDAGCASALLAIAQACDQISAGRCEAAIAGGALIHSTPNTLISACQLDLLSRQDAGCALDERSDGMMPGEAVGAIVLKPLDAALADGDRIHCVIEGWGSNHNGRTHGIVAPNADAQAKLFAEVYEHHGINPATVTFVEANASGMPLADRAEIQALSRVFSSADRRQACVLGTVENNVGHAFHASGVSHFIKTALALRHRRIPATLNVHRLDRTRNGENIADNIPFVVNAETIPWNVEPGQVRRAAMSSFGATGSNVHLVVSEAPAPPSNREPVRTGPVLIALSARTTDGLRKRCREFANWLQSPAGDRVADLRALSANLLLRRTHLGQRCAFVVSDRASLIDRLFRIGEGEEMETVFHGSVEPEDKLSPALTSLAASKIRAIADSPQTREEDLLILADLYVKGIAPDMSASFTRDEKAVLSQPAYPFEKRRCWISAAEAAATPAPSGEILRRLTEFVCELTGLLPAEIQTGRSLRMYGVDSLMGMRLLNRINAHWGLNCDASILRKDTLEEIGEAIPNATSANLSSGRSAESDAGETLPGMRGAWRRPAFIERLDFDVAPEEEPAAPDKGEAPDEAKAQLERLLRHGLGVWAVGGRLCFEFFRGTHTRESIHALVTHAGSLRSLLEEGTRYYPATFMQRFALNISEVDRTSALNIGQAFWIDAPVNRELLNRALKEMMRHHSILRTGVRPVGNDWAQAVYHSVDISCRELQWPELQDRASFVQALHAHQNERLSFLFDVRNPPMLEVYLLHNGRDLAAIYFHTHHFHADGFTLFLFLQELHGRYRALVENAPWAPPVLGAEFAHFALSQFDPADRDNNRFWRDLLERRERCPMLRDRAGYPDSETRTTGSLTIDTAVEFPEAVRRSGVTLTQLVACAIGVLIYRVTGRNMSVQMVFNLRDRFEFENVFGDFSSSAPLILPIEPSMTLRDVFDCYQRASTDLQIHKRFDFIEFISRLKASEKWSGISIDSNDRDALCQVTDFAGRLVDIPLEGRETVASVVVCLMKTGGRLSLQLSYDRSMLSSRTMELFGRAMKELLITMANEPDLRVLDFQPPSELLQRLAC